jgi:twinkle protein
MHIKELSDMLWNDVSNVVKYLLPNGKKESNEWVCGSVDGEKGKSLKVNLGGKRVWSDFSSGDGGDLIDLWMLARGLNLPDTIQEVKEYLGVKDDDRAITQKKKTFKKPDRNKLRKGEKHVEYLKSRGLTEETIKKYKIAQCVVWDGKQEADGMAFPYIRDGECLFIKSIGIDRPNGKKVINASKDSEPCLFGWHMMAEDSKTLIITEGEIDCMSLNQIGLDCVLSVPFGGGSGNKQQWIDYEYHRLDRFEDIYICMDNDDAGKKGAEEIAQRLGIERCFLVKLPYKDANECIKNGMTGQDFLDAFSKCETFDPDELKNSYEFMESVWDLHTSPEQYLFTSPFPEFNDFFKFREHELTIINAQNGHGKSQLANGLMLEAITQGVDCFAASMEFIPKVFLRRLYTSIMCTSAWKRDEFEAASNWINERLWMYNVTGTAKTKKLLETIRYAAKRYGVKLFLIDSLMKCGIGEDDYNGQKAFLEDLADLKNELPIHILLITHSKKIENEDRPTGKMDVKGTGAITDIADNVMTIWRNKPRERAMDKIQAGEPLTDKEKDMANQPSAILGLYKQRNGDGSEGAIGLEFDLKSMQYYSIKQGSPYNYLLTMSQREAEHEHAMKYGRHD